MRDYRDRETLLAFEPFRLEHRVEKAERNWNREWTRMDANGRELGWSPLVSSH